MSCSVCKFQRSNVRFLPCLHIAHARCIYPWSVVVCPTCNEFVQNVQLLDIEPFTYQGESCLISNYHKVFGTVRKGRWTTEEQEYVEFLVEVFSSGMLPIERQSKLRTLLCKLLQCQPARLVSKLGTKKKLFNVKTDTSISDEEIAKYVAMQRRLSDLEDKFLGAIVQTVDLEEASILSYHIQYTWSWSFLRSQGGMAYSPLEKLSLNWSIRSSLAQSFSQLCSNIQRQRAMSTPGVESVVSQITPFFHSIPFELGIAFNRTSKKILSSTYSFQQLLKCCPNVTRPDYLSCFEGMFTNAAILLKALQTKGDTPLSKEFLYFEERMDFLPGLVQSHEEWVGHNRVIPKLQQVDSSGWCTATVSIVHVDDVGVAFLSLQQHAPMVDSIDFDCTSVYPVDLTSLTAFNVTYVHPLGSPDASYASSDLTAVSSLLSSINQRMDELSPYPSSIPRTAPSMYKRRRVDLTSVPEANPEAEASQQLSAYSLTPIAKFKVTRDLPPPQESTVFANIQKMMYTEKKPPMLMSSTVPPTLISSVSHFSSPAEAHALAAPSSSLFSLYKPLADPSVDPFSHTLLKYLRRIPFELLELWVPVKVKDSSLLLLAGCVSTDETLIGWSSYSRSFSFGERVGIPGRVSADKTVESFDDVTKLHENEFLRLGGARTFGIHASVGIPLKADSGSPDGSVAVLYSKQVFKPSEELISSIVKELSHLKVRCVVKSSSTTGL